VTALWEAPFYAAMSFTNTGFTPNAGGLAPFAQDYFFLTVLMAGVLGSIGFPVIFTLWRHHFHVPLVAAREAHPHHDGHPVLRRRGVFLLLEYDNPKTFGGMDAWDTTFQAFFLSAMTRSGGFSIVDIGQLNGSSLVVGRCSCSWAAVRHPPPAASR
jgi:Trk-type K+ transport system membrane component